MPRKTRSKLTAEQRAALEPLTAKRRAFVLAYVGEALNNASEAARMAGFAHPGPQGYRLLQNVQVQEAVQSFRVRYENEAVCSVEELQRLASEIARGEVLDESKNPVGNRLTAIDKLGKMFGAFTEKREVSGPGGGPVVFGSIADAERWAREDGNDG